MPNEFAQSPTPHSKGVSFIFPVYNEELIIEKMLRSFYEEFKGKLDFEMIVAEDGSSDGTKAILERLKGELPVRIYLSQKRKGYLQAIKDSLKYSNYKWICLVDSDNQFDPKDFWKLWPYAGEYDVVLGRKIERQDGFLRSVLSKGYNFLLRFFFRVPFRDMDTGFRLIKRDLADKLADEVSYLQFFTAEFVIRAYFRGAKIIEVPVKHFKRESGRTNIFYLRKLPSIVFLELFGIYRLFSEIKNSRVSESKPSKISF